MSESFAAALRAELDAVVGRYEALVRALAELGGREAESLRAEIARLSAENERWREEANRLKAEAARLAGELSDRTKRVGDLEKELAGAEERAGALSRAARAAEAATQAYEEQFAAERRFVEGCRDLGGSLLGEALQAVVGRPIEANSSTFAALKARGLEATLAAALRERGRSSAQAPLLDREKSSLPLLATSAGCELYSPAEGARFSAASMEKAGTVSDPAEEGNVVSTAMPGLRRAGTDGSLVFPRVIVASG